MLPLRDADVLTSFAERLYGSQTSIEARQALRRIDTYRRLLGLPLSINAMERAAIRAVRDNESSQRTSMKATGTARHSVFNQHGRALKRLAG